MGGAALWESGAGLACYARYDSARYVDGVGTNPRENDGKVAGGALVNPRVVPDWFAE